MKIAAQIFPTGRSVLKPLRGLDPNSYPAFVSQIQQDYPEFEVLFGAADAADPPQRKFGDSNASSPTPLSACTSAQPATPNAKVRPCSAN